MKKKDLYRVMAASHMAQMSMRAGEIPCDIARYVRADSFAEAEKKALDGIDASDILVVKIERIVSADMCID